MWIARITMWIFRGRRVGWAGLDSMYLVTHAMSFNIYQY